MRRAASGLILLLAMGLQACCFRTDDACTNEDAAAALNPTRVGTLKIGEWGPRETNAGVPSTCRIAATQPSGSG